MAHRDAQLTDVVVVLKELDVPQLKTVVDQLKSLGMNVDAADDENCVVEGCIDSTKVPDLHKLDSVRYVRPVATYIVDYPPGDPRDLDGADTDFSEDGE